MSNLEPNRRRYENDMLYGAAPNWSPYRRTPTLEDLIAMRKNSKNYSARIAALRGERTISSLRGIPKTVIGALNPLSEKCRNPNERLLYRTASGKHYRMAIGLAALLSAEIADQTGVSETIPPTVLVTVDKTVGAIERYAAEVPLEANLVIESVRQMVAHSPGNLNKD